MRARVAVTFMGAFAAAGCAPVFSDLQSARLAGRGRVELTPSASAVVFSEDETEHVQDHVGVQLGIGVHDRIDLRARFEHVSVVAGELDGDGGGVNVVGFGPKLGLVKDRLAFALPVGFAFGSEVDSGKSWQAHPTLIGTLPLGRHADLTATGKYLVSLNAEDADNLVAVNLGLGLGPATRWVVRPEVGFLWNPGEEGHFMHVSLGLSYLFGGR